jgi:hypothetical protein
VARLINGNDAPPLIVADRVRWNRSRNMWILVAADVVTIALTIGLSVGLTADRSTSPPAAQQQLYLISENVLGSFRDGLPLDFVEAVDSPRTSHAKAYEWLRLHPPLLADDESHLRLRLTQRFALASFFFSHNKDGGSVVNALMAERGRLAQLHTTRVRLVRVQLQPL